MNASDKGVGEGERGREREGSESAPSSLITVTPSAGPQMWLAIRDPRFLVAYSAAPPYNLMSFIRIAYNAVLVLRSGKNAAHKRRKLVDGITAFRFN